jgi:hypothetical protein
MKSRARKGRDRAGSNIEQANRACEAWNAKHPIGTPIRYWEVLPFGPIKDTTTRSETWVDFAGTPVVMINGHSGYVSLHHVVAASELHPDAEPKYGNLP